MDFGMIGQLITEFFAASTVEGADLLALIQQLFTDIFACLDGSYVAPDAE